MFQVDCGAMKFPLSWPNPYERVPLGWKDSDDESEKHLLGEDQAKARYTKQHKTLISSVALSSIGFFALGVLLTSFWMPWDPDALCARYTSRACE